MKKRILFLTCLCLSMCYAGALVSLLIWLLDTPSALADPMLGEKLDALIAENLR